MGYRVDNLFNASVNISDNTLIFSNSGSYAGAYIFNDKIEAPYSVEMEYIDINGSFTFGIGFVNDSYNGTNANFIFKGYYGKVNNDYWGTLTPKGKYAQPQTGDKYRFEVYNDKIDTYVNNEFFVSSNPSVTVSPFTGRFAIIGTDSPCQQKWKNIKIKKI